MKFGTLFATVLVKLKRRCYSMEVINSADFFGANIEVREENFKSLLKKETEERYLGNYDEPMYFFKGAIYGLLFCLPFWTILIWLSS